MSHGKRQGGWTVGSLREERAHAWPGAQASSPRPPGNPAPPPALRGLGCCRSGCFGCPWADGVRRQGGFFPTR